MGKEGFDNSHYNKTNWKNVKTDFCISKCTEGNYNFDPTFANNKKECRARGIPFGGYHFARGTDAIKEANWFVKNYGDVGNDILALDWEIQHPHPQAWCLDWLKEVERLTGVKPIIYMNSSTAKSWNWALVIENGTKLWIANYGVNDGTRHPNPPTGKWPDYFIHQYTSRGRVAGVVGNCDLDYMPDNQPIENTMYTPYSQTDLRWRFKFLGNSWSTIGSYGCKLCSLSMMVGKEPPVVNELLKKGGAFTRDLIDDATAARVLGLDYDGKQYNIDKPPKWSPSIKEVNYYRTGKKFSQHFVLRVIENGVKSIIDPLGGVKRRIDFYPFRSYRLFRNK